MTQIRQQLSPEPAVSSDTGMDWVITKVSKSGYRYFYTGEDFPVDVKSGDHVVVAGTSLFHGDALRFRDTGKLIANRDRLNRTGIGGALWKAGQYRDYAKPKAVRS